MDGFTKARHRAFIVVAVRVLVAEKGVSVGVMRRKLNGAREELDRAFIIASQGKAIPDCTPSL